MYGFNHRHHDSIKNEAIVDGGKLGKILWMRGRYGKEVDEDYFTGWRADLKACRRRHHARSRYPYIDLFLHFAGDFDEHIQ